MRGRRGARRLACGLALALALIARAPRPAAGADPYRDVSLALAQELIALFPAVEGHVVSASGDEAYVDAAATDLVRPRMELQVYRPGGEMLHPVTGQAIGSYEEHLGLLHLIDVRDTYSRGRLDAAGAAAGIRAGDRARISSRRLRALLHVAGGLPGIEVGRLAQALLARGEESGRFAMIDEPAWAPALTVLRAPWERVRADPALLRLLGESAKADVLWLVRVDGGAVPRVAIEVRSLLSGSVLADLSERWPSASPAAAAAAGEYTERELAAPARALAAGDIVGGKRLEVLLTDGVRLALYRWEPKALSWLWDEDGPSGRRILSLDAADLDGDGKAEVLVTSVAGGRVHSEVRRWRDGGLQVVAGIEGYYLRAAPRPGGPARILGQPAGIDEVLSGRVEQYHLREGSLEPVAGGTLPAGVGIFGLALAPESGPVALHALESSGRIAGLTASGAVVWRSPRQYGGYPTPVSARELFGPGPAGETGFVEGESAFRGRLLAGPAPRGVRLAVPRNDGDPPGQPMRLRTPGQGEIALLEGPPESLQETRLSRVFRGYVADLAFGDIDGDGRPEILFVVNRYAGPLLGERGTIVAWRPDGSPGAAPAGRK